MINYKFKINLEGERETHENIVFTSGDKNGYKFEFVFYSNGEKYNASLCALTVKAKRPDGAVIIDSGVTDENGAYYIVADNAYSVKGELEFEIALVKADGAYATTHVIYAIVREGFGEEGVQSEDNEPVLSKLEGQYLECCATDNELNEAILKNAEDINDNKASIQKNELESRSMFANVINGKKEGVSFFIDDSSPFINSFNIKAASKNLFVLEALDDGINTRTAESENFSITGTAGESKLIANGHPDTDTVLENIQLLTLEPGVYTVSVSGTLGSDYIYVITEDGRAFSNTTAENSTTINLTEKTTIKLGFVANANTSEAYSNTIIKIQIEKGGKATKWVEYVSAADADIAVCGKNIIPFPYDVQPGTYNGVTLEIDDDGVITLNGTANNRGFSVYILNHDVYYYVNGNLTFSGISGGTHNTYHMTVYYCLSDGMNYGYVLPNGSVSFNINGVIRGVKIEGAGGTVFNNLKIKPMLELGRKASAYEQYKGTIYKTDENGEIKDITKESPVTTFLPYKENVVLDCDYLRDTNAAYDELKNAILNLGGNI